jgi:hypothetical protein
MTVIFGIFMILHGMVHLLYAGQSARFFELRPGMLWPDGPWAFSSLVSNETSRLISTVLLGLVALGFLVGGLGLFLQQTWWRPAVIGAAVLSALVFILFWDGKLLALDVQGGIGVLISMALLGCVVLLKWPA